MFVKIAAAISHSQQVGICSAVLAKGNRCPGALQVPVGDATESTGIAVALAEQKVTNDSSKKCLGRSDTEVTVW